MEVVSLAIALSVVVSFAATTTEMIQYACPAWGLALATRFLVPH